MLTGYTNDKLKENTKNLNIVTSYFTENKYKTQANSYPVTDIIATKRANK